MIFYSLAFLLFLFLLLFLLLNLMLTLILFSLTRYDVGTPCLYLLFNRVALLCLIKSSLVPYIT